MKAIAHVREKAKGDWQEQSLEEHLRQVASRAKDAAQSFQSGDWAELAGLWHDLGKYKPAWQDYIRTNSGYQSDEVNDGGTGKVDHTAAGAIFACSRNKSIGKLLAYLIAGHHTGLPDWQRDEAKGKGLEERLREGRHWEEAKTGKIPQDLLNVNLPGSFPIKSQEETQLWSHLWIRMLFSCLVDADFLDAEAFMNPGNAEQRKPGTSLEELRIRYDRHMEALMAQSMNSPVNDLRRQILEDCRTGANLEPGWFSLSVPTGGGKTLASMGFALDHALTFGKERIIVAIPFTSIIEQTAETLRQVFGDENVLEHHSNLDPERETTASKLATENWDAPIVVTTNVQLFESLFAARTSSCRKLHNVVDSVIILDEAQTLPSEYLKPILSALQGLVAYFHTSVVLCTATQPALTGHIGTPPVPLGKGGFEGIPAEQVRELMRNPLDLSAQMRRTRVTLWQEGTPCPWDEIAQEMQKQPQVLCIVNRRQDCRDLHALLPAGTIHLSALMCGEHRSLVVKEIKEKLQRGEPIRVVSTQLVEAGVDIDFPVVFRAMAGLDSIAQAAGRCNREGRLDSLGQVVVFQPLKPAPIGLLRKGEDAGKEMFRLHRPKIETLEPEAFQLYFKCFYNKVNSFDEKRILDLLAGSDAPYLQFQFRTAAQRFQLIDDAGQKSVAVWFENKGRNRGSRKILEELRFTGPSRNLMRKLQRFTVTVPQNVWSALWEQGAIEEIPGPKGPTGIWAQCVPALYDTTFGLRMEGPEFDGMDFIC
ncbi:MAG TPA: CRISPR-associated helicase Cas3' [Fibrobacteraceae bacterium]|nr:CRISPR-associated helicase Cas3' [Fibrobacteraceae bacterium]